MSLCYGQIVVGAPGAGKSTYCTGLAEICRSIGRPCIYVNLDPANEFSLSGDFVDIRELVQLEEVMNCLGLGPNGALRYCMQTLRRNLDWLLNRLSGKQGYVIIDMPGQLELYNSDDSVREIVAELTKRGFRLCAVHLNDSMHCSDAGKFVSVVLSSLSVMINLEVPQINVLSKVDLLNDNLPFDMSFFEELPDLKYLTAIMDDHPTLAKYKCFCERLAEVVEDYNLVNFLPLDVSDKEKMIRVLKSADGANGFAMLEVEDLRNAVVK